MPAASSLLMVTSTRSSSSPAEAKVSTGPVGRWRTGTSVCRSASTCSTRRPVTKRARSSQWEPMSATARSAPASSGSSRQFQSVGRSSQSCR